MDETEAVPPREPFFAVGLGKLVLLGVSTLGLYQVVWLLMHWRHRRDVWGERINAGVRAIIVPQVFIFPLAYRMGVAAKANHVGGPVSTLAMAALWAVLSVAAVLAGAAPLAVLLLLIPLVLLQATANRVNRVAAPRHQPNTGVTTKNWLVIGCGSLVWLLVVASWSQRPERACTGATRGLRVEPLLESQQVLPAVRPRSHVPRSTSKSSAKRPSFMLRRER